MKLKVSFETPEEFQEIEKRLRNITRKKKIHPPKPGGFGTAYFYLEFPFDKKGK